MALPLPRGFTLIEMLVALSVMGMVLGITAVAVYGSRKNTELIIATEQIADVLYRIRVDSLAGKKFNGAYPAGGHGVALPCGAASSAMCIFADTNNNTQYDEAELVRQVVLADMESVSDRVFISALGYVNTQGQAASLQQMTIVFQAPYVRTSLFPAPAVYPARDLVITLAHSQLQRTQTITINAATGLLMF